jgi:hypothetical protein
VRSHRICSSLSSIASLALTLAGANAFGATASNARSPLGMNLQAVNYYTNEQPFLNIFKTTWISKSNPQGWQTHRNSSAVFDSGEGRYVQTDENGYPTTLIPGPGAPDPAPFSGVGVIFLYNLGNSDAGTGPNYPAGLYVVLYDGQGTLSYGNDAKLVSSAPGRDVFKATPTYGGGIDLRITATDPHHTGNYLRNIRVVKAEQETLLTSGGVFNPTFLSLMQNFRVLRGMQWLQIDDQGGLMAGWSQRPRPFDAGWGGPYGTPVEALLELCNATGADCWLNIPHAATNDYITQMAILAHSMLGSSQKAYVEYSNEVWNSGYAQFAYANAQGRRMWPGAGPQADYGNNWYGMRVAQTCDIWKSAWGADASRIVCVMGASAAVPWTATEALNCELWKGGGNSPCSGHGIGAVAIAPYFAYVHAQTYWTTASDGGLKTLFLAIDRGDIQTTSGWEAAYRKTLARYHLPLITYEGGQTLVSSQVSDPTGAVKNLYIAANRDPRMGAEYTTALNDWRANGGQIYTIYADINKPSEFGEWGALESVWDTVTPLASAPPKWQAIQNFIAANPCWWPGCVGIIGRTATAISAAPANPTVK